MNRVLLPFPAQAKLAQAMLRPLDARLGELSWRRFPDGESLVTVDSGLKDADVAIVASLNRPDEIALALRFAAETASAMGARSIGLVAPYLAYMRQDTRFHSGEAISASLFARFIEGSFDWLVTVDPHMHRNPRLAELFGIPAINVAAAPAVADWLRGNVPDAILIGPDAESSQWVAAIANRAGLPWQVLDKVRRGDTEVEVSLPDAAMAADRTPVLVDDIVSTGHTMLAALGHLRRLELRPAICIATHALFAGDARARLLAAGAARLVSTDTIPDPSNAIAVAALLAAATEGLFELPVGGVYGDDARDAEQWFADDEPAP